LNTRILFLENRKHHSWHSLTAGQLLTLFLAGRIYWIFPEVHWKNNRSDPSAVVPVSGLAINYGVFTESSWAGMFWGVHVQ